MLPSRAPGLLYPGGGAPAPEAGPAPGHGLPQPPAPWPHQDELSRGEGISAGGLLFPANCAGSWPEHLSRRRKFGFGGARRKGKHHLGRVSAGNGTWLCPKVLTSEWLTCDFFLASFTSFIMCL